MREVRALVIGRPGRDKLHALEDQLFEESLPRTVCGIPTEPGRWRLTEYRWITCKACRRKLIKRGLLRE